MQLLRFVRSISNTATRVIAPIRRACQGVLSLRSRRFCHSARRCQYRLHTLLALAAFAAIVLSAITTVVHIHAKAGAREASALRSLRNAGMMPRTILGRPWVAKLGSLCSAARDPNTLYVSSLSLDFDDVGGDRLRPLRGMHKLATVELVACSGVDDAMRIISQLRTVEHLDLSGTDLSDAGLHMVGVMKQLRTLRINYTSVTDDGIAALVRLPRLEYLQAEGISVTGHGLSCLRELHALRTCRVSSPLITTTEAETLAAGLRGNIIIVACPDEASAAAGGTDERD